MADLLAEQKGDSMTQTNDNEMREKIDFEIDLIIDDIVTELGCEPDGHRTWAKTTDEIGKEIKGVLREKIPSLLSSQKQELLKEIWEISKEKQINPETKLAYKWLVLELESRHKKDGVAIQDMKGEV